MTRPTVPIRPDLRSAYASDAFGEHVDKSSDRGRRLVLATCTGLDCTTTAIRTESDRTGPYLVMTLAVRTGR